MGSSAPDVDQRTDDTRRRVNARRNRVRYRRIAVIALGTAAVCGAAILVWRRKRKPTLKNRLEALSIDSLREMSRRAKEQLPSVTVRINEKQPQEPGAVDFIREIAPVVAGAASRAVFERITLAGESENSRTPHLRSH